MEATGIYREAAAAFLAEQGHAVSVVNPAQISAFSGAVLARTKTDKKDARLIAQFCAERNSAPLLHAAMPLEGAGALPPARSTRPSPRRD